jgi:hypothetical protein
MSNYDYEDDDDFTQEDSSNDLVKQLRKASKQKDKELQELRSQFETCLLYTSDAADDIL